MLTHPFPDFVPASPDQVWWQQTWYRGIPDLLQTVNPCQVLRGQPKVYPRVRGQRYPDYRWLWIRREGPWGQGNATWTHAWGRLGGGVWNTPGYITDGVFRCIRRCVQECQCTDWVGIFNFAVHVTMTIKIFYSQYSFYLSIYQIRRKNKFALITRLHITDTGQNLSRNLQFEALFFFFLLQKCFWHSKRTKENSLTFCQCDKCTAAGLQSACCCLTRKD